MDVPPGLLAADDLARLDPPEAEFRIPYGDDPLQFGDLRIPVGPGPHSVAILLHGGCWLAEHDPDPGPARCDQEASGRERLGL
jgi:hypothetical protein